MNNGVGRKGLLGLIARFRPLPLLLPLIVILNSLWTHRQTGALEWIQFYLQKCQEISSNNHKSKIIHPLVLPTTFVYKQSYNIQFIFYYCSIISLQYSFFVYRCTLNILCNIFLQYGIRNVCYIRTIVLFYLTGIEYLMKVIVLILMHVILFFSAYQCLINCRNRLINIGGAMNHCIVFNFKYFCLNLKMFKYSLDKHRRIP